ncbi:MAG: hypothetical protein AAF738_06535, partial [Bacteroidota bacterium]
SDASVQATILDPAALVHGQTIRFTTPQAGNYTISVTDGKSCPGTAALNVQASDCNPVVFNLPNVNFAPGSTNQCVDITVSNFVDVFIFQFPLEWDPAVLEFVAVENLNPSLPTFTLANSVGTPNTAQGELSIIWGDLATSLPVTLPENSVLFSICFNAIGNEGDSTSLNFRQNHIPLIGVADNMDNALGFQGNNGSVLISNQSYFLSANSSNETCNFSNDGTIIFEVGGGIPPYNYELRDIDNNTLVRSGTITTINGTDTLTMLPPGEYQLITIDSNTSMSTLGDIASETVEIQAGLGLGVGIEKQSGLVCANDTSGVIRAEIFVNTIPVTADASYQIEWRLVGQNTVIGSDELLRDARAGLQYEVSVSRDDCTVSASRLFTAPLPIILDVQNVQDATCIGKADGSAAISISGGRTIDSGSYTVEWQGGDTDPAPIDVVVGNPAQYAELEPGTYFLTASDDNGCMESINFEVAALRSIAIDSIINDLRCFNDTDASIQVTASALGTIGEARPYSFSWTNTTISNPIPTDTETTSIIENLSAATYRLNVRDADGCTATERSFTIDQPEQLVVTLEGTRNASCANNLIDGAIDIEVTGGTMPYNYFWPEIAGLTTENATSLSPGQYEVVVTDANGCLPTNNQDLVYTITAPDLPQLTITGSSVECFSDTNGTVSVNATSLGGTTISSYVWSNGETGQSLNGLTAGEYIVTVTDADGCPAVDTAFVDAPARLSYTLAQAKDPSCPNSDTTDGELFIEITGGSGVYNFEYDTFPIFTGNGGYFFSLLPGGVPITIEVIDTNGCDRIVVDTMLNNPVDLALTFPQIDSTTCSDSRDGAATVMAAFEDGSTGTFDFNWQNSQFEDTNTDSSTATDLTSGTNIVEISYVSLSRSDVTCMLKDSVEIPSPPIITSVPVPMPVSCFGNDDGTATVTATGGAGEPYTSKWSDGGLGQTR